MDTLTDKKAFKRATMAESKYEDVTMDRAEFENVSLCQAEFRDVSLVRAKFHDVNMSECELDDINLSQARCNHVSLFAGRFRDLDLSCAVLQEVNLGDTTLADTNLGGAKFIRSGRLLADNGSQSRPRPVTFEEGVLCDSVFRKVDLSGVKIEQCNVQGMMIDGVLVTDMLRAYRANSKPPSSNR